MKKKPKVVLMVIIVIVLAIPILNYSYYWKLDKRFPGKHFYKLEVHELLSKRDYTIKNETNINQLYYYISKQRGRKIFTWFSGGLHGLSEGDEHYTLIFESKKELGEDVHIAVLDHKAYLSFTDGWYLLSSKGFNIQEFRNFLK